MNVFVVAHKESGILLGMELLHSNFPGEHLFLIHPNKSIGEGEEDNINIYDLGGKQHDTKLCYKHGLPKQAPFAS